MSTSASKTPHPCKHAARRHLWMHFTRMSTYADHDDPDHRARRGRLRLGLARQALPRRPVGTVRRPGRPRPAGAGRRAAKQAASWPTSRCGPTPTPGAIELAERLASYAPGDINRVFFTTGGGRGGRERLEARPAVLQADRPAAPLQGDQPRHRLPRHHDGRAVDQRRHRDQERLRAAGARQRQGAQHELLPRARSTATTSSGSASGPLTRSSAPSCAKGPSRSRRSSSSRCRTPAAASRRRPATSRRSARSATSTACCSSATR